MEVHKGLKKNPTHCLHPFNNVPTSKAEWKAQNLLSIFAVFIRKRTYFSTSSQP